MSSLCKQDSRRIDGSDVNDIDVYVISLFSRLALIYKGSLFSYSKFFQFMYLFCHRKVVN